MRAILKQRRVYYMQNVDGKRLENREYQDGHVFRDVAEIVTYDNVAPYSIVTINFRDGAKLPNVWLSNFTIYSTDE